MRRTKERASAQVDRPRRLDVASHRPYNRLDFIEDLWCMPAHLARLEECAAIDRTRRWRVHPDREARQPRSFAVVDLS